MIQLIVLMLLGAWYPRTVVSRKSAHHASTLNLFHWSGLGLASSKFRQADTAAASAEASTEVSALDALAALATTVDAVPATLLALLRISARCTVLVPPVTLVSVCVIVGFVEVADLVATDSEDVLEIIVCADLVISDLRVSMEAVAAVLIVAVASFELVATGTGV